MKAAYFVLSLAIISGCTKKEPEVSSSSIDAATAPAPPSSSEAISSLLDGGAPTTVVTSRSDPNYAKLPLFDRLAVENQDRPKNALRPEVIYASLKAKNTPVTNPRQVLGWTWGAGYCELADVEPAITLLTCQYDDQAALEAGHKRRDAFKMPNRDIIEVKNAFIEIARAEATPAVNAKAKEVAEIVKKL